MLEHNRNFEHQQNHLLFGPYLFTTSDTVFKSLTATPNSKNEFVQKGATHVQSRLDSQDHAQSSQHMTGKPTAYDRKAQATLRKSLSFKDGSPCLALIIIFQQGQKGVSAVARPNRAGRRQTMLRGEGERRKGRTSRL